jgi:hypothetical protein
MVAPTKVAACADIGEKMSVVAANVLFKIPTKLSPRLNVNYTITRADSLKCLTRRDFIMSGHVRATLARSFLNINAICLGAFSQKHDIASVDALRKLLVGETFRDSSGRAQLQNLLH